LKKTVTLSFLRLKEFITFQLWENAGTGRQFPKTMKIPIWGRGKSQNP